MRESHARQSFLGEHSDEVFAGILVGVVGLGGGGSHIVQQLAHIGVRKFLLYDPDRCEASNLNRLIGATPRDARRARHKTKIARRLIHAIVPNAQITAKNCSWQRDPVPLRSCDAIFGCIDDFTTRLNLEQLARRYCIPYIDIGMDVHKVNSGFSITGQVALSMPGGPCLTCMSITTPARLAKETSNYGAAGTKPQVVWPNGVLASTAVGLFVNIMTPWSHSIDPTFLLEYDGDAAELTSATYSMALRQTACPHYRATSTVGDPWYNNPISSAQ